jgi:hypothetical protein
MGMMPVPLVFFGAAFFAFFRGAAAFLVAALFIAFFAVFLTTFFAAFFAMNAPTGTVAGPMPDH